MLERIKNERWNQWKTLTNTIGSKNFSLIKQGILTDKEWDNAVHQQINENWIKYWKYEVLLRLSDWLEAVNLGTFLNEIEKNNVEFEMDIIVLEKTLLKIAESQERWDSSIYQINIYPATFCDVYFQEFISYLIEKTRVDTSKIIFELLESWRSCKEVCNDSLSGCWDCIITKNIEFVYDEYWIKTAIDDFWNWNNNTNLLEKINWYKIVKIDGVYLDKLFKSLKQIDFIKHVNWLVSYLRTKWIEEITFERIDMFEKFVNLQQVDNKWLKISYQGWLFHSSELL